MTQSSDGNIRYFEYQNDKFEYLSEYKSADPQRGIAFLPKRGVNTHENEIMRAFKTVNDAYIEPVSFIVPRRAEVFQDDIFPPVVGSKPAMSAGAWFEGKEGLPPKIDLASVYAGEEPAEVLGEHKPAAQAPQPAAPSPTKKEPEPALEPTEPASALRSPPPSMKEQTSSIKDLASKFTDDNDAEDEDDTSSFEEVAKPVDRSSHAQPSTAPSFTAQPPTTSRNIGDTLSPVTSKPSDFDQASQIAASQSTAKQIETQTPASKPEPLVSSSNPLASSSSKPSTTSLSGMSGKQQPEIQNSLAEIKNLLEEQTRTMGVQSDTIGRLTAEVDRLRSRIGE